MMHAKTAVVDGALARVGSTNLNLLSWLGNWELDVIIENEFFAQRMEAMFLDDLSHSTEIVLDVRRRRRPIPTVKAATRTKGGSAGRTAAGVMRLSNALGAAISNRRELGRAEATIMWWGAGLLVIFALVIIHWPRAAAYPTAALSFWTALSLMIRAFRLRH
jgi:cardiolipin synthase